MKLVPVRVRLEKVGVGLGEGRPMGKVVKMHPNDVLLPAVSGSLAVCVTHPLELTKSRLQLDNERAARGSKPKYNGFLDAITRTARHEGFRGLQRGLSLGICREFFFNGSRIGLYEPILALYKPNSTPSPSERLMASLFCGALGGAVVNPLEILKVRMQVQGGATGYQHPYEGVPAAVRSLVADEGLAGCLRGIGVSTMRGILGPGTQLISYNEMKAAVVKHLSIGATATTTHVLCALGSAAMSVLFVNPVDCVRTRLYNAPEGWYTSGLDAAQQLLRGEGLRGFYKGALANYLRLGPHMVLVFSILEKLKQMV